MQRSSKRVPAGSVRVPGTPRSRPLGARFSSPINALDFLPVGVSHASMLSGANNTDLTSALQGAFNEAFVWNNLYELGSSVIIPRGTWYCDPASGGVRTPSGTTGFARSGVSVRGEGLQTILTQKRATAGDVVDYSDPAVYVRQALLRIHCSNVFVEDLAFDSCINAIYMGQDPDADPVGSEVSFCRLGKLSISNTGTGLHMACATTGSQGSKYNTLGRLHIYQCQIGLHVRRYGVVTANNNRNTFQDIRLSRCNIGGWIENGDTNTFLAVHTEGCHADVSSTPYALPAGAPDGVSWGWAVNGDVAANTWFNGINENNDNDLYLGANALANRFISGSYTLSKIKFVAPPLQFSGSSLLRIDDFNGGLNNTTQRTDSLSGYAPGVEHKTRPMIIGATPWGVPATGLPSSAVLAAASSSSNPPVTAFRFGNTSSTPAVRGAKTRGATADSLTVPDSTDILLDLSGWAADGVDRYREGAGVEIAARTTPSATNTNSGVNIKATPAASLIKTLVAMFDAVANAVNNLTFKNAASGAAPEIGTNGGNLKLAPATGIVQFGTHTALGAETVTGYVTIADSAGNTRKIAVVS